MIKHWHGDGNPLRNSYMEPSSTLTNRSNILYTSLTTWPELLEAWLALTGVNYHRNV